MAPGSWLLLSRLATVLLAEGAAARVARTAHHTICGPGWPACIPYELLYWIVAAIRGARHWRSADAGYSQVHVMSRRSEGGCNVQCAIDVWPDRYAHIWASMRASRQARGAR